MEGGSEGKSGASRNGVDARAGGVPGMWRGVKDDGRGGGGRGLDKVLNLRELNPPHPHRQPPAGVEGRHGGSDGGGGGSGLYQVTALQRLSPPHPHPQSSAGVTGRQVGRSIYT